MLVKGKKSVDQKRPGRRGNEVGLTSREPSKRMVRRRPRSSSRPRPGSSIIVLQQPLQKPLQNQLEAVLSLQLCLRVVLLEEKRRPGDRRAAAPLRRVETRQQQSSSFPSDTITYLPLALTQLPALLPKVISAFSSPQTAAQPSPTRPMGLLTRLLPNMGSGLILSVLLVSPTALLLYLSYLGNKKGRVTRADKIRPSDERVLILGASGASPPSPSAQEVRALPPFRPGGASSSSATRQHRELAQAPRDKVLQLITCPSRAQMGLERSWRRCTPAEALRCKSRV